MFVAAGPVSRILSAGRSGRTAIPLGRALLRGSSDLPGGLTHRAGTRPAEAGTSSLFGLAPCGVCPARCIAAAAVRSYRTFSPLPQFRRTKAVCFLWHFPSADLEVSLPDVIRHTALRSSDFPLPCGSGRPAQLPTKSLYSMLQRGRGPSRNRVARTFLSAFRHPDVARAPLPA